MTDRGSLSRDTTISIVVGLFAFIIAMRQEGMHALAALVYSVLGTATVALVLRVRSRWTPFYRLRNVEVGAFIEDLTLADLVSVDVICHTGKHLATVLQDKLATITDPRMRASLRVRVLARDPFAESTVRATSINGLKQRTADLRDRGFANMEVRFVQSLPVYRAIICEYSGGDRCSFISSYEWHARRSRASAFASIVRDTMTLPSPLVTPLDTWIDHFWGNDEGDLHTIVFDFDDTLAQTMDSQVSAWTLAITEALTSGHITPSQLVLDLQLLSPASSGFRDVLRDVFFEHGSATAILAAVLPGASHIARQEVETRRSELRTHALGQALLFPGVKEKIRNLSSAYQLVIVSATFSANIRDFLKAHELLECFSHVLGKEDVRHEWENVSTKATQLLQVSLLTGIPLTRMVFVGDNSTDYDAAKQVGVRFIEARRAAQLAGRQSLISGRPDSPRTPRWGFDGFGGPAFDSVLEAMQREKD